MSAGQLGALGINAFAALVLAKIMGPAVYGIWQAMLLVNLWVGNSHLGALSTLSRELPVALDRGSGTEASRLNRAACSVFVLGSALFGLAGMLIALSAGSADTYAWMLFCTAFPLVAFRFYAYERLALEMEAIKRAAVVLLSALVFLAAAWSLAPAFGLNGVVAASLIQSVAVFAVLAWGLGLFPGFTFKLPALFRVVKAGWLFWLASMLALLDGTAGRLVVLALLPAKELGLYGLALVAALPLLTLASSLELAMKPRLVVLRAKGGEARPPAASSSAVPLVCWLVVLLQGLAYCLAPEVVRWILPEYEGAVAALKIMVLAAWLPFAALGCQSLLLAANAKRAILSSQALSLIGKLLVGFWLISAGWGVAGMAAAYCLGELVKAACLIWAAWPYMSGERARGWLELVFYNAPIVLVVAVLLVIEGGLRLWFAHASQDHGLWLALYFVAAGGPMALLTTWAANRLARRLRPSDFRRLPLASL